jgi:hypothetical protein
MANQPADPRVERLSEYLRDRIADGDIYFKSKYVADDLDFSAHEIGALFVKVRELDNDLTVEQWACSNGTTWRVRPAAVE